MVGVQPYQLGGQGQTKTYQGTFVKLPCHPKGRPEYTKAD